MSSLLVDMKVDAVEVAPRFYFVGIKPLTGRVEVIHIGAYPRKSGAAPYGEVIKHQRA